MSGKEKKNKTEAKETQKKDANKTTKKQKEWYYDYLSDKEKEAYDFVVENKL